MIFSHQYLNICLKYAVLLFIALLVGCNHVKKTAVSTSVIFIKNIDIVDVLSGEVVTNQDVVVKNDVIYFIGKSFSESIPEHSTIIVGTGKYLCPGLWDMHFHLCWDNDNDTLLFPLLLANGITGIRDMGGDLTIMRNFKREVQDVEIAGPEIFGAGPIIDGNPPVHFDFSLPVDNHTNMNMLLDSLKNNGADFFKTYSLIQEAQLKDIAVYGSKNNMHFAGHLSEYIEPETSISLGQRSVEHLNRLDEIWQTNTSRIDSLANLMVAKKTALCPTLITYQLKTKVRDTTIVNNGYTKYIPTSLMTEWKATWAKRLQRHSKLDDWQELEKTFIGQRELVKTLHQKGVMILAGSDFAGMPYVYPAISLHQELRLLVDAGLSNYEALKTATVNPAIYMNRQQNYGSVSVGKYADLLVLEKNPLENIDHLKLINRVIVKGKIVVHNN